MKSHRQRFRADLLCLFFVLASSNVTSLMAQVPTWGKDQKTTVVGADKTGVGWTDLQNTISAAGFYCPGVVDVVPSGIDQYGYVLKVECAITRYFRVSVITGYGIVVKSRAAAWHD